jgi:hypothetical protein
VLQATRSTATRTIPIIGAGRTICTLDYYVAHLNNSLFRFKFRLRERLGWTENGTITATIMWEIQVQFNRPAATLLRDHFIRGEVSFAYAYN